LRCLRAFALAAVLVAPLAVVAGCSVFGAIASKLPEPEVDAAYKGLAGQNVAVMVWADPGVRLDFERLQLDTAASIQAKLIQARDVKIKELENASFPILPESIVRYQREHPELDAVPAIEIAPRLRSPNNVPVSRLIYVEFHKFGTRADQSIDLWRGGAEVTIRVFEVKDGKATIGFEQDEVRAYYPKNAPPEGMPSGNDYKIYVGTVDAITTEVCKRFVPHPADD
jgi:hypothetical protein